MSQDLLTKIHGEVLEVKGVTQRIEAAFPKDEQGNIDYLGHRIYHNDKNRSSKEFRESKTALIRGIATWVAVGLLALIGSNIWHSYLAPLFKLLRTGAST